MASFVNADTVYGIIIDTHSSYPTFSRIIVMLAAVPLTTFASGKGACQINSIKLERANRHVCSTLQPHTQLAVAPTHFAHPAERRYITRPPCLLLGCKQTTTPQNKGTSDIRSHLTDNVIPSAE